MIFNVINAAASKLVSISVVNSQSTYQYYADINRSALTVTATYKNGKTKVVTSYSVSPTKATSDTIYVYYSENGITALATFNITILGILEGIAAVPSKSAYGYAEAVGATTTAYYNDGTSAIVSGSVFSPASATNTSIGVSYTENGITKTYTMPINVYPVASQYVGGTAEVINEGSGEWIMECLTSGTLDLKLPYNVDVWCVGGGGGGGGCVKTVYNNRAAGGGGGGYVSGANAQSVLAGSTYPVTIGAGGTAGSNSGSNRNISGYGGNGGTSSAFSISASGGIGGVTVNTNNSSAAQLHAGGNGGSGGGGLKQSSNAGGAGGSNGSNGSGLRPGVGGLIATNDFGEPSNTVRAGGGGGGSYGTASAAIGGSGGGGNGGAQGGTVNGSPGMANYGGGGGGGAYAHSSSWYEGYPGGAGGSGIVIIRTHRDTNINKFAYEYDGLSSYMQETNDDWYLSVTGSGTLTVKEDTAVDIYLLGGGQSGYKGETNTYGGYSGTFYVGGAGGQGGFVNILSNVTLTAGDYSVVIGNGGTGNGGVGGTTSLGTYQAPGGGSGATGYSGGASGGTAGAMSGSGVPSAGGAGADSTIYDFNGVNRGGGGGGGYGARYNSLSDSWSYSWSPASGGEQGGARSMTNSSGGNRTATVNYGGGGSGNTGNSTGGGAGGSGYILIRNHRS